MDTRSRLLDEAAQRFLDDGYAETSVRTIADAMGIKAGSIYYHFESKDDLLAEVLDTGIERITRSVESALEGVADPRTRLVNAVHAHLWALFEHGAYTACHVRVFRQAPEHVQKRSNVARDRYEAMWDELLADASATGLLRRDVDPTLARLFLLGALNTTVEWVHDGPRTVDEIAHSFARMFLEGTEQ